MTTDLSEFIVTKMHPVVHASYAMTVNEQRVLLACISQIDPRFAMPDGKTYILTVEQARDLFYTDKDARNVFKDLSRAVENLYERDVKITLPNGDILQTRFVQSIVWSPDNLQIQVKFADDIKPYLSELKSHFSSYKLTNIVQLKSIYAIRLYEWFISWSSQNQYYKELEIAELREKLVLDDKYSEISSLKKFVIEPAIKQINEKTDFQIDVSYKKFKREVRWIQFRFNQKPEIVAIENERKAERKLIAEQNRSAKIKREYAEQKAAEQRAAEEQKRANELAEQQRQEQEKAAHQVKRQNALKLWQSLNEEQREQVKESALKTVYAAYSNSMQICFDENNTDELTGRFFKDFQAALQPFEVVAQTTEQLKKQPESVAPSESINSDTRKEYLQMLKDGLITKEEFILLTTT